ncbi:MAG: hypothetical protein BZY75_02130 [SAR202 cluster bacterium Io17-Chloro-G7]|nr:MAG: hypothetical protein BZY75_02130 [SAR202 cluster bacterium Io17-Chloro-G7]
MRFLDRRVGESPIFVGRSSEFVRLATALDDALENRGRLVMLAGEPGIGKTRIMEHLASRAEAQGASVLWGWSYEEEGAPPYWPWMQLIRAYIQGKAPDRLISDFGPGASDVAALVPELRQALPDLEPSPPLEPEQARFRLFESITTFLKNAARTQPLMLVLDDLHWADGPSLLLLQFLARVMADSSLLVVGAYRNMELSREHPLSKTIAQVSRQPFCNFELLSGLSRQETGSFIEAFTGFTPAQDQVGSIYSHTEGNPFFLSQVITLLSNRKTLSPDSMEIPQRIEIPPGVRGIIGQRLNGLSPQTAELLTIAAIWGREFDYRQLGILDTGLTAEKLLETIDEGLAARLIEELPGGRDRYRFTHSLIQQVLVEDLSASRRMRLHLRAAEALASLYGPNVEAHASELAHHFAEGDPALATGKQAHYSLMAGEQTLASNAYEEALRLFVRGLAAKEGQSMDAESSALLFGLGKAQAATHQRREAVTSLTRAFDYYADSGDVGRAVAVAEYPMTPGVGRVRLTPLVSRALQLLPPATPEAGRLLARHGWCLSTETGDFQGARQSLDQAMAISQKTGDLELELQALGTAAQLDLYTLRLEDCKAKSFRASEVARIVGDLKAETMAHISGWSAMGGLGEYDRCIEQMAAGLGLAERLRDRTLLVTTLWQNSMLSLDPGRHSARLFSDRGLELASSDALLLGSRALLEHQAGFSVEGEAYLDRLVDVMVSSAPGPTFEYLIPAFIIPMASLPHYREPRPARNGPASCRDCSGVSFFCATHGDVGQRRIGPAGPSTRR